MNNNLKILDIEKFVKENNLKEVSSPEIYLFNTETFDPKGVYSEEIFGKIGSEKRMKTFAYIDLKDLFIHPEAFDILKKIVPNLQKVIYGAQKIKFDENKGIFIQSEDNEGKWGVKFIYETLKSDKFNWDHYRKKCGKEADFVYENLDLIFVKKWLVLPAGIRDIQEIAGKMQEQEISKEYRKLIYLIQSRQNTNENADSLMQIFSQENTEDTLALKIQNTLIKINKIIQDKLKSKGGLIRSFKLSKRVDHAARLVLGENKDLKPNEVEVPWFVLLKLYEPFVMHYILNNKRFTYIKDDVEKKYGTSSVDSVKEYLSYVAQYPKTCEEDIKEKLIEILDIVINGKEDGVPKYALVLRHPVESRDSILALRPIINKENIYVAKLPQTLFSTLGADCSWDEITIKVNGKLITCHIKDLLKHVKNYEIYEFVRKDGVKVKLAHIKDDVKILSFDLKNKKLVIDKILTWFEHKNIKMNKLYVDDHEFIMSPHKETLVTSDFKLIKPDQNSLKKKILQKITYKDIDILNKFLENIFEDEEILEKTNILLKLIGKYLDYIELKEILNFSDFAKAKIISSYLERKNALKLYKSKNEAKIIINLETENILTYDLLNDYFENLKVDVKNFEDEKVYVISKVIDKKSASYKELLLIDNLEDLIEAKNSFDDVLKNLNSVKKVEKTNINVGWDITTQKTGLYIDKYGYVKKQCDGDQINIYALHTKEALEELKQIDPVVGEKGIFTTKNYASLKIDPAMDIALTVWELTKKPNNEK